MRYAVLALIVVGVLGIGAAVDRSGPSRVALPAIELHGGTQPSASPPPAASAPILKRAYGGRSLTRASSPQADRQPQRADDDDRFERPRVTTTPAQVPTDAGADDVREDSAEAGSSSGDDAKPSGESDKPRPPQEPLPPETPETPETPDTPPVPETPPSPGDPAPTDEDEDEDGGGSTPTPAPATPPVPATDDELDDDDDDDDDDSDDSGGSGSSGSGSGSGGSGDGGSGESSDAGSDDSGD